MKVLKAFLYTLWGSLIVFVVMLILAVLVLLQHWSM